MDADAEKTVRQAGEDARVEELALFIVKLADTIGSLPTCCGNESRARSIAVTKLDEAKLWLAEYQSHVETSREAGNR